MKIWLRLAGVVVAVAVAAGCDAAPTSRPSAAGVQTPAPRSSATPTSTGSAGTRAFPGTVILGRPTAESITLSLLSAQDAEVFVQYGKSSSQYDGETVVSALKREQPLEIKIGALARDTQYFYRVCHRSTGEAGFSAAPTSSFHTQRAEGETFVFTVDADPHFDSNSDRSKIELTFRNILNEHPDFNIDLGDTFMTDKLTAPTEPRVIAAYSDRRTSFAVFGSSVPLLLAIGNHDGESGWLRNGTENNLAVWASKARKVYYPNPLPDGFYRGNTIFEPFVGLSQDYYAFEWGSALFVVLDPYWYTTVRKTSGWDWTLGREQYDWFKSTLQNSRAKFKFVFIHHLVGGSPTSQRGGAEVADLYEWGGHNADRAWGFDAKRPGWGEPVEQLLVDSGVTIVFHGHDHFFAQQEHNGIVYQECPQPGSINPKSHAEEYDYKSGTFLGGAGHVRVTVSEAEVIVDYIRTFLPSEETATQKNGQIAYSYTR